MHKRDLSIIILNHNTKNLLSNCLKSIQLIGSEADFEVLVVDNGSHDGSVGVVKKLFPWVRVLETGKNLGFAKGNNFAKGKVLGEYVLFLNSDTEVEKGAIGQTLRYLKNNNGVGAITCKIVLPDGRLDKDARRRFPTPWVSFSRLILRSGRLYWYGDKSEDKTHQVDVIQGAFFMARRKLLDDVGWFDEDYFLDGEDIDLCWKIKEQGYKIIYYPKVSIKHIKKATKKLLGAKYIEEGVSSMEIFYKKRLWKKYPLILNYFVLLGISFVRFLRFVKAIFQ
jgi:hypothetical protein